MKILVINPGSTSTKVAVFRDRHLLMEGQLDHDAMELNSFARIADQLDFRKKAVADLLDTHGIGLDDLTAVSARGGLLRPLPGGTYRVDEEMCMELRREIWGAHASNLGALIADDLSRIFGCPSYVVDPVVVDELSETARFSGHPEIPRRSIFHALNQRAMARTAVGHLGLRYGEARLVVAHMGGGISVAAHDFGRVVDVNNALDGDGPFSPERTGSLPVGQLVDRCFVSGLPHHVIRKELKGGGGLVAYCGTNDFRVVRSRAEDGDSFARAVCGAMAYQIAKEIGMMAAVLCGRVDGIVLTGGLAYDPWLCKQIASRVSFIAQVVHLPGEAEMTALRDGVLRVLSGEETAKVYGGPCNLG